MSKARDYAKSAAFIFCLTFKPSEPHLTAYLVAEGLTQDQVNTEVRGVPDSKCARLGWLGLHSLN